LALFANAEEVVYEGEDDNNEELERLFLTKAYS